MSLDACAALVQKGDPERFRAAMCAPMPVRGDLMALYAFNLEVARAPFASEEPMIAEMRVQWWLDVVGEICDGAPARAHEVVAPLAEVVRRAGLDRGTLEALVEARRWDARRAAPGDLEGYLADTGGGLMGLAAAVLGAGVGSVQAAARAHGWASGAANYLCAVPELKARGWPVQLGAGGVPGLARAGLARLAAVRDVAVPKAVAPAFLPGWEAERMLMRAFDAPGRVAQGQLQAGPVFARLAFGWRAVRGRI